MNYEDLTAEQKAKALACKTPDELLELAKQEGYELTDEQIESVAGGGWTSPSCRDDTVWTFVC